MGLPNICKEISKEYKFEYDLSEIFSKLIHARILYPSSKKYTLEDAKGFLEPASFELHQIYRALEVIAKEKDQILLFRWDCSWMGTESLWHST